MLGVILCPGDRIEEVVVWVRRHKADANRVFFFLHERASPDLLLPWREAGFETNQVATVSSWRELHRLYGLILNDRVYADWK